MASKYIAQRHQMWTAILLYCKIFECHMDPLTYFSVVIDTVSLLIIEFKLDYVEVVSILGAFAEMPYIILYFTQTLKLI